MTQNADVSIIKRGTDDRMALHEQKEGKGMEKQKPHIVPSIYLANYLNEFESTIKNYNVTLKKFKKGEFLTQYGVINNTAYFVKKGILHLSLGHDQGKKSLCLFGNGTIFPVGVEIHSLKKKM